MSSVTQTGSASTGASRARDRVTRYGIIVLVFFYALANVALLRTKPRSFDELRTFSQDELHICFVNINNLLVERSFVGERCNPQPYAQLYPLLVAAPLMVLQSVTKVSEAMVIGWATVILVLAGIATLVVLHRTAARIYGPAYGILAVLALLSTREFWKWSNEIHPDIVQLALMTASFYWTVRLYEASTDLGRRALAYTALAALFAGLAAGAKFNGIFLVPLIALAYNRAFLDGGRRRSVRTFVRWNLRCGAITASVFGLTFALSNPCYVAHPEILGGRLARIRWMTSGKLSLLGTAPAASSVTATVAPTGPLAAVTAWDWIRRAVSNLALSNYTFAHEVVGYGLWMLGALGVVLGLWRLVTRYRQTVARPIVLADVFTVGFLFYSLVIGYGLIDGRLFPGYGRYLLPVVPMLIVSGLQLVEAAGMSARSGPRLLFLVLGTAALIAQVPGIRGTYEVFMAHYLRREQGFFRVASWVRENVPVAARVYTEEYIHVPPGPYGVKRDYAVSSLKEMEASDYVITKSLHHFIYSNPVSWRLFGDLHPEVREARKIYELLEKDALPRFRKVAEFSAGDRFGYDDLVIVYENVDGPRRHIDFSVLPAWMRENRPPPRPNN